MGESLEDEISEMRTILAAIEECERRQPSTVWRRIARRYRYNLACMEAVRERVHAAAREASDNRIET